MAKQVLSDSTGWTYTFTNLPKYDGEGNEIYYTIEEQEVNSGDLYFYDETISGSIEEGFTITNKFVVPDEKVSINVSKTWVDTEEQQDKRPSSVTVVLKNGETEVERKELNSSNNWAETFTNLARYDSLGNEINYTVEEVEVNEFYVSSISGDMENGYVITNTFTRPEDTIKIIANKVWNDNSEQASRRPESITLVAKNSKTGEEIDSKVVTADNLVSGTTNQWSVEFTELPKYDSNGDEIEYAIEEKETTEGDLHFYKAEENNVIVEDGQATIRNNFVKPDDTISVTVRKEWKDEENVNGRRPNSIKLQVKNGESVCF